MAEPARAASHDIEVAALDPRYVAPRRAHVGVRNRPYQTARRWLSKRVIVVLRNGRKCTCVVSTSGAALRPADELG